MSFLELENKHFVVFGVANKKSIAWHIAKEIEVQGGEVLYAVHTQERAESIRKLVSENAIVTVCDVGKENEIAQVAEVAKKKWGKIDGIVHSIAFASYNGPQAFHETTAEQFLETVQISCFSLVSIANSFREILADNASVIAISISATSMAAENYGWMAPAKAALDSTICFLAKSFSAFSEVRFNAVAPGLLKTSSSAGIPGYIDSYLFAERCTLRGKALQTKEAADTALFLLSSRSSGINGQKIVVDAGMGLNYFDSSIVSDAISAK